MRVTVGIPIYESLKPKMAISLIGALVELRHEWMLTAKQGCYIDVSREECVKTALAQKSDYLVFIDTDMEFPGDAITRLLEHRKDVVGGAYNEKRLPPVSTVKMSNGKGGFLDGAELPSVPFKCAAVATGFMAINLKRMVQLMAPPFFAYETATRLKLEATLGRGGEDVAFCVRANNAGMEVWCDPTIPLKHWGEYPY